MSAFEDFPPDAWVLLTDLEAENTTAFFDANRRPVTTASRVR